jgi:uncharacterized repeat protein (TIGR03803 family)
VVSVSAISQTAAQQYTLTTLASFGGSNVADGIDPRGGLISDASGNFYGTTGGGGSSDSGTVFELAAGSGTITTLASFNGTNGAILLPGGLTADSGGNLYGTTALGGTNHNGTVFELAAGSGTITTIALFGGTNGANPDGGLVADASGNLFGTTSSGGAFGHGTVFELTAGSHALTTLASFNGANGAVPIGNLIADSTGNLYGATSGGGTSGLGTVFELPAGSGTITTLASFLRAKPGVPGPGSPSAGLVADASGNLFGMTSTGGANSLGTVFELAAGSGTIITLASFGGANGSGGSGSPLTVDASGNLFGTAGDGSVFEIAAGSGAITTLAVFNDGSVATGGLLADSTGNLYGTTPDGGANVSGSVFKLSPVPEPSTIVLLSISGLAALWYCQKCRQRQVALPTICPCSHDGKV